MSSKSNGDHAVKQTNKAKSSLKRKNKGTKTSVAGDNAVNQTKRSRNTTGTQTSVAADETKRTDYLKWDQYFMGVALISAQRSKDPDTQVGACIINPKKRIVGVGYNGMPDRGIVGNDGKFPWTKNPGYKENKHFYVCHAEMNAIVNKMDADLQNCTIYTTLYPCNECSKLIIQSGIREVVYLDDKHPDKHPDKYPDPNTHPDIDKLNAARVLLETAKIEIREYKPEHNFNFERLVEALRKLQ